MFFTFMQNNTGGRFTNNHPAGISHIVIIEAVNETDAIQRAEHIGLYFDGNGDCNCCGNRWYEYVTPDVVPTVYGIPVTLSDDGVDFEGKSGLGDKIGYIHYLDGTVKCFLFQV